MKKYKEAIQHTHTHKEIQKVCEYIGKSLLAFKEIQL